MDEYISREAAVDAGYLSDWYISSVGVEPPVWTDAHIDELLNDFLVIPKDTKVADVQPIKHGRWIAENRDNRGYADCYTCTNCNCYSYTYTLMKDCEYEYCPNCGARMDGDAE